MATITARPVRSGRYLVRASRSDYRTTEREISVPDPWLLTRVLLANPEREGTTAVDGK